MKAAVSPRSPASDPLDSAGSKSKSILEQFPELQIHDDGQAIVNITESGENYLYDNSDKECRDCMEEDEDKEKERESAEEEESYFMEEDKEVSDYYTESDEEGECYEIYDYLREYYGESDEEEEEEEEETYVVNREDILMEWDTKEEKEMENTILSMTTKTAGNSPATAFERVAKMIRRRVSTDAVRKFLAGKFWDFLNSLPLQQQIEEINSGNKSSLEIDYNQIKSFSSDIADFLVRSPKLVLAVMQLVARKLVFAGRPAGSNRNQDVYVRITELPLSHKITDLSFDDVLTMVHTRGVVAGLSYHLSIAFVKYVYYCGKCKENIGPYQNSYTSSLSPCPSCESIGLLKIKRGKPFYKNYQAITLKEDRETVADIVVIMLNDHIDFAKPGDHIEVTGLFIDSYDRNLSVEANYVKLLSSENKFTEDDLEKIDKLSKDPNIGKLIIKSLATSIYGHEDVKTALALSMFSGQLKYVGELHRRKDVNVLLIGYPGTVKSQIREYVERTGQRFVYTTGKGFSEVGLIGAVRRGAYPILQAGPLVYADMGICLIDDFEKMSEQDSGNIDEALEQQKISRSWDGGVKTLDARCSVVAAANPSGERYDALKSFYEQVKLNKSTISHFDIICIMKVDNQFRTILLRQTFNFLGSLNINLLCIQDEVNPELIRGEKYNAADPEIIPSDLLQKYITFARLNVSPHLDAKNFQELEQLYPELRNGELLHKAACDHHITERRHLEAVIRISEALAKMHLRSDVIKDDVEMAIEVMLNTCSSQQESVCYADKLLKEFVRYIQDG
ncbi:hypothetical protein ACJIZ3_020151 [Penstemon smallii]|uniref:DNA helicase n=1 Tax=Penstemon smallii TaxID=265156 RepID=A0ABD3SII4_9LAMI